MVCLLDDRIVLYLQKAGLCHLAMLNETWFRLDELLVSVFVERWRLEMHTFHMSFGECTIMLEDVVYQLGLPIDGEYVNGCLTNFERYIEGGRPAWAWTYSVSFLREQVRIRLGARLDYMGRYSWRSAVLSWLYRCMCRVANRNVVKSAGPLQLLQLWIFRGFPSFMPDGFDACHWPLASRWSGYQPTLSEKRPRVAH
ncbi:uncharacterized protein DS421_20g697770 [Arachis hypogaea]|nr:uncharacterized protein DS421_20g697770 [Arachis hypogaea]